MAWSVILVCFLHWHQTVNWRENPSFFSIRVVRVPYITTGNFVCYSLKNLVLHKKLELHEHQIFKCTVLFFQNCDTLRTNLSSISFSTQLPPMHPLALKILGKWRKSESGQLVLLTIKEDPIQKEPNSLARNWVYLSSATRNRSLIFSRPLALRG